MSTEHIETPKWTSIACSRIIKGDQSCGILWCLCGWWTSRTDNHGITFKYRSSNCWELQSIMHWREGLWFQELYFSPSSSRLCLPGKCHCTSRLNLLRLDHTNLGRFFFLPSFSSWELLVFPYHSWHCTWHYSFSNIQMERLQISSVCYLLETECRKNLPPQNMHFLVFKMYF